MPDYDVERKLFEEWFYGKGVSSYATKMYMWSAWWARAFSDHLPTPCNNESKTK